MEVVIVGDVRIENCAVVLRHIQRGMPQKALQREGVPAAVNEVFAGEGVPEQMYACLLDAALRVVAIDGIPQRFFRKHIAVHIAE